MCRWNLRNSPLVAALGLLSALSVQAANIKIQAQELLPIYTVNPLSLTHGLTDQVRVPVLELGINMNIRREDAEHFQLRVSTEEQLLLRNIMTVLQGNPDNLTLTRMQGVLEMVGRMLFDQFVKSLEEKP
jgi:hypothetical protein